VWRIYSNPDPHGGRKQRRDKLNVETSENIQNFFGRPGVSTNLLSTRRIKNDQLERKVLDRPMKDIFVEYKEENPNDQII
jgi:hypothetical protein